MQEGLVHTDRPLPAFLYDEDILVPLKCDVTLLGARYVDTFTWNLYRSALTPDRFAARTVADLVRNTTPFSVFLSSQRNFW